MGISTNNKKLLYEVSYIRPIVIFLLVFLHSFEKITSGGGNYRDYQLNHLYEWVLELIKGFRIETIALVAGYVFAYQAIDLGRKYKFGPFVAKKFKRLILPMLFFGLIYYFCFYYHPETFSFTSMLIELFSGCGHLWFLPMLFWCFIIIWIIDHYNLCSYKTLLVLALISIISIHSLPLGFSKLPHFLFYVFGGYYLWTKHEYVQQKMMNKRGIVSLWLCYVTLVEFLHFYKADPIMYGIVNYLFVRFVALLEACAGTLALYFSICSITYKTGFKPSRFVVESSSVCYGVYVYHQFILVWLYFNTPLYENVNEYILPIVGFVITFVLSLIMTRLSLKTRFGRYLIG